MTVMTLVEILLECDPDAEIVIGEQIQLGGGTAYHISRRNIAIDQVRNKLVIYLTREDNSSVGSSILKTFE